MGISIGMGICGTANGIDVRRGSPEGRGNPRGAAVGRRMVKNGPRTHRAWTLFAPGPSEPTRSASEPACPQRNCGADW